VPELSRSGIAGCAVQFRGVPSGKPPGTCGTGQAQIPADFRYVLPTLLNFPVVYCIHEDNSYVFLTCGWTAHGNLFSRQNHGIAKKNTSMRADQLLNIKNPLGRRRSP